MGFFSKTKTTTIPATGFYKQPKAYQNAYSNLVSNINDILLPDGGVNTGMFSPLGQTPQETAALAQIEQGFTPTPESLQADIAMQMNPFDDYVINDINRQAEGDYSIFKKALDEAGAFGSNRQILGANDIENTRLNMIGRLKQGQYNQALQNSLGALSGLRRGDAAAQMGAGEFLRNLDAAERMAPLQALSAAQSSFNALPTTFGDFGDEQRTIKTKTGGFGSFLGSLAPIVGSAIGGPIGGVIGGAVGGAASGGGLSGALQGGLTSYLGGLGGASNFGLSTGGEGFFSGGARNALNANLGYYGPGF